MWFRQKDFNLNIKNADGHLIAIVKKTVFKYCFYNRYNKKKKVRVCLEGNNFIDINCNTDNDALKVLENIKSQVE